MKKNSVRIGQLWRHTRHETLVLVLKRHSIAYDTYVCAVYDAGYPCCMGQYCSRWFMPEYQSSELVSDPWEEECL